MTFPVYVYEWSKETDHIFNQFTKLSESLDQSRDYFFVYVGIGIITWILDIILFIIWRVIGETVSQRFRKKYLEAFVKRKVEWLDQQNLYQLSASFKDHCKTIEHAIGDKVGLLLNLIGFTLAGAGIAIWVRWTFALFLLALVPIGAIVLVIFLLTMIKKRKASIEFYTEANGQAVEATSLIKTVKLLGTE